MYENQNNSPLPQMCTGKRVILTGLLALSSLAQSGWCEDVKEGLFKEGTPQITVTSAPEPVVMPRLTDLARELSPSVVNISVEAPVSGPLGGVPNDRDDSSPARSSGSGFIIHEDGFIVTSNHVIDKSEQVLVRLLDDKTDYPASVVGKDAKTDIALLKIEAGKKLKPVFVGDSDALQVGEWVLAIGNQFQLGQTVTAGIVSAKSRRVPSGSSGPYDAFIQTDASINPGSSGGPLFNSRGQVVGINTAIFSPGRSQFGGTGFNIGIGFAIPINMARSVLSQLRESGRVTRGLLGVLIQQVDGDVAKVLGVPSPDGALVSDVVKGTPAEAAGIKRRDVIVSFNGVSVREHEELPSIVANTPVGSSVPVEFYRGGKKTKVTVTITQLKDTPLTPKDDSGKPDAIGVVVEGISPELARSLQLDPPVGVAIVKVEPGSLAERAGLLRGDVVEEIDGKHFKNGDEFREFIKREFTESLLGNEKLYMVLVRRREGVRYVVLKRGLPKSVPTPEGSSKPPSPEAEEEEGLE
jgi:serine protease Do